MGDPARLAMTPPADAAPIGRGGHYRTHDQHSVRTHRPMLDFMARAHAAGGRFRTLDEPFDRVII
ncbi:hypothetical protein [Streptomyces sp. NPDC018833]|uniref:hypothetical protein n=1 Tax=Streptomyces sp. NPDC018833 TaxID=3365053 RepID=UPI0037B5444A